MKSGALKYFVPAAIWAAAIFVVSAIPDFGAPKIFSLTFSDKAAHFIEYFIFGTTVAFGLHRSGTVKTILAITVLLGFLYGASDEIHQYFVPGRSCDPFDLVADTFGALPGAALYLQLKAMILKIIPWGSETTKASKTGSIK